MAQLAAWRRVGCKGSASFSLFLRERVGVRGSSRAALADAEPYSSGAGRSPRRR